MFLYSRLCCLDKSFLQVPVLSLDSALNMSFPAQPMLPLDMSGQEQPVLPLDIPLLKQSVLSLDVSMCTVPRGVWPAAACASPGHICSIATCAVPGGVWPTSACAALWLSVYKSPVLHQDVSVYKSFCVHLTWGVCLQEPVCTYVCPSTRAFVCTWCVCIQEPVLHLYLCFLCCTWTCLSTRACASPVYECICEPFEAPGVVWCPKKFLTHWPSALKNCKLTRLVRLKFC